MRYIESNPVRAKDMVEHPAEYPWSSYRRNARGVDDDLITEHLLYHQLGKLPEDRCIAYQELFKHSVPDKTLEEIRTATNKAWVLGSEYFIERTNEQVNRQALPKDRGGDRKSKKFSKINKINRV